MILCLPNVLCGQSPGSNRTVSIDADRISIKELFKEVHKQTGMSVVYNVKDIDLSETVDVHAKSMPVTELFAKVISPLGVSYVVRNNSIVIQQKDLEVKGKVVDKETGEPLIGVSVYDKKNGTGAATGLDGEYSISVKKGTTLTVSYIGYEPQEKKVERGGTLNFSMSPAAQAIQEVVVTGIVNRNKTSFTGSASSFTGEDLKAIGVQNPIASLAALDPAFNVLTNDLMGSDPNSLPDINIRGKSSVIGSRDEAVNDPNQPLFIVDGFESTLEAVFNMDINRIESMTILKDAASTAIYGSKAANGVVVVETVKPKAGKLRASYSGSVTVSKADLGSYNMMNSKEKLEFERLAGRYSEGLENNAQEQMFNNMAYNERLAQVMSGVDTYWMAVPLRTGVTHKHNVYVDGGSGGFMFGLGINYSNQDGVMKDSKRTTYGGNLDLIYRLNKLRFQNQFSLSVTDTKDPVVSYQNYVNANPYYKMTDDEGHVNRWLENTDNGVAENPLYNASLNSRIKGSELLLTNNFILEYDPIQQLRLRVKAGISHSRDDNETFVSPLDTRFEGRDATLRGSFDSGNNRMTRYDGSITAVYADVFGNHRINVAGDFNLKETRYLYQGYQVVGFPEGNYTYPSFANGYPEGSTPTYYEDVTRSTNLLGTINYSYDNRYLMDFNYALSGASMFGSSKKFRDTWSVGLGWNINNESFFREAFPGVTMLKLRGSIGNPGNQDFNSAMSLITYRFLFNAANYFGPSTVLDQMGNRNLKWQNTLDKNIGLDFHTDRWNLEFDYYDKKTDPLLISISAPLSTGITSNWNTNMGIQRSKGFLGSVSYYVLRNLERRLTWSLRATFRHEEIKLDELNGALDDLNKVGKNNTVRRYYDGADPDAIWAVRSAGIDPANGREMFVKKDGSFTYDYDDADEVIVGNTRAKVEGAFGTTFSWQGFTLTASFNYKLGGKSFNEALFDKVENISSSAIIYNQDRRALYDRWQKPGDHAQFRNIADAISTPMSSRFVQRNNSLTLQTVNLSYDFYDLAKKLHMEALRVSLYANDLFWLTSVKQERGTAYPFARSFTFALNFTF